MKTTEAWLLEFINQNSIRKRKVIKMIQDEAWNEAIEVGINSFYPVAKESLVDILSADIIKNKLEKLKK